MNKVKGTPKTLDEALENAMDNGGYREPTYAIIKDFIAQKFGAAYMEAQEDKKTLKVLENLFEALTIRN